MNNISQMICIPLILRCIVTVSFFTSPRFTLSWAFVLYKATKQGWYVSVVLIISYYAIIYQRHYDYDHHITIKDYKLCDAIAPFLTAALRFTYSFVSLISHWLSWGMIMMMPRRSDSIITLSLSKKMIEHLKSK